MAESLYDIREEIMAELTRLYINDEQRKILGMHSPGVDYTHDRLPHLNSVGKTDLRASIDAQWPIRLEWPG